MAYLKVKLNKDYSNMNTILVKKFQAFLRVGLGFRGGEDINGIDTLDSRGATSDIAFILGAHPLPRDWMIQSIGEPRYLKTSPLALERICKQAPVRIIFGVGQLA